MASSKDKEQAQTQAAEEPAQPAEEPAQQPTQPTRLDCTVPGGRYLVGGRWLNANGTPLPDPAPTQSGS